jgi:hypothetical protein
MLLGRWSSNAFLRCIRKDVEEFGTNVSQLMIETLRFHSVPELAREDTRAPKDPRGKIPALLKTRAPSPQDMELVCPLVRPVAQEALAELSGSVGRF